MVEFGDAYEKIGQLEKSQILVEVAGIEPASENTVWRLLQT